MPPANNHNSQSQTLSELNNIHDYSIDTKNREIFLHSYYWDGSEDTGVDYRSALILEKNLRYLNTISEDPILIHMHIQGGDYSDLLGMYDAIKLSPSKIGILAYSKSESCSSIILQAADYRVLMPSTYMLIHYGSISIEDHSKAAVSVMEWNQRESDKMITTFAEKCMATGAIAKERNWKLMMAKKHIAVQLAQKGDWILDAEEAVYHGFADAIFGKGKLQTVENIKSILKKIK